MSARIIKVTNELFTSYQKKYSIKNIFFFPGLYFIEIKNSKFLLEKFKDINTFSFKNRAGTYDFLLAGSFKELEDFITKFSSDESDDPLKKSFKSYVNYDSFIYKIGEKVFNFNKPYIMGVLNVTPDSFSDGGKYLNGDVAVEHALKMIEDGADIIDIGGESTRPGSDPVDAESELERILPVIEKILSLKPDSVISVDTNKSIVAEESLKKGVKIINDISGLTFDPSITDVVKKYNASLVIMHIKGTPKNMQQNVHYDDLLNEVYEFLITQTEKAKSAGINNIFIDPGIGFAKNAEQNFEIIRRLDEFKSLGYPVLIGVSRKSFIGKILNLDIDKRDVPTSLLEYQAMLNGARVIRTHNAAFGSNAVKLFNQLSR